MADGSAAHDAIPLTFAKGVNIDDDRKEAAINQEAALIGCLLTDPSRMSRMALLAPEHFAVEEFGRAFKAMQVLTRDMGSFTPRSVHEKSGVSIKLLLRSLTFHVSLVCVDDYAREIRQSALIRAMIAHAQIAAANGLGAPPRDIANMMRKAMDEIMTDEAGDDTQDAAGLGNAILEHVGRIQSGQAYMGASTGLPSLDAIIGGYRPGELVVVAARPGMGKTVFAVSSARQVAAAREKSVAFFSLEIGKEQTGARFLSDQLRDIGAVIPYSAILRGRTRPGQDEDMMQAASAMQAFGLYTTFEPGIPLAQVDAKIEQLQQRAERREKPLAVVFIDYLKFLKAADRYKGNRVLEIGEITGGLKEIAKKRGVCIVLLTQLNRGVEGREDKRPTLMDLRDSGEIEQDADIVLMLYREAYYLRNPKNPDEDFRAEQVRHELDVLVEKNRAGECGTVKLWCDVATSSVRDMEVR